MTFVLDASIAAAWVLPGEQSDEADAILDDVAAGGALAPSLLWYELRNILVVATRRGRLPAGEAVRALGRLRRLPIETVDMTMSGDAGVIEMAERHRLSAYDAAYLALSHQRKVPIATADKALIRASMGAGVVLFDPRLR